MRMWIALLVSILVGPWLAGCSSYHPLKNGIGYTEVPLGADAYQVTFVGDSGSPVAEVRQNCLTRAAELAVLRDMPFFQILDERVYLSYGTQYYPGTYYGGYGYPGYGWGRGPYRRGYYSPAYPAYQPGYAEVYTVPEVTMQVRLLPAMSAANAIPAAYVLREAERSGVEFEPAVRDRLARLPAVTGDVHIPPPPTATTKPRP